MWTGASSLGYRRDMTKWIGVLAVSCLVLAGCPTAEPACTPGMSIACVGEGGCSGGQVCLADGSGYGTCGCGGSDAGMDAGMAGTDAPVGDTPVLDVPVLDAPEGADGGTDAGPDVGPPVCAPRCEASERCCGADCVSLDGVIAGTDGRTDPSFDHCSDCGMACDANTASSCSVRAGSSDPSCSCGMGAACPTNETCAVRTGGAFACRCGDGPACAAGNACDCRSGSCECIDIRTNRSNCGSIGNVCERDYGCYGGVCGCGASGTECDAGEWCCVGSCVDLDTDVEDCGACGTVCAFGEACVAGSCQCGDDPALHCTPTTSSSLGQSCCGGACLNNTDASCHCEDCRPDGYMCVRGPGDLFGGPPQACCGTQLVVGGVCAPGG